jgi:L-iditol 2-dehydrogenase
VKAALTFAPHETRVEDVPDPVCGPEDVVCRVLACATCRSDVGTHGLPAVLGHEPAGEVVAVGRDVRSVAVGDEVAILHRTPCGTCSRCRSGHETLCQETTALEPGGFAEYVRIPGALVGELLPLDGLDPVVATLTEPLASALRAQDRVGLDGADSLLIVGAGASGLLQVAAARSRGVGTILVREPDLARRERAERWGAAPYTGQPVDVAIVCTPAPRALADAAEALDAGGRLCLYATAAPGTPTGVDAWTLLSHELTITASWAAGPQHMRAALALLRAGAVPADELISARFSLACTGDALTAQRSGAALKAVVMPWA